MLRGMGMRITVTIMPTTIPTAMGMDTITTMSTSTMTIHMVTAITTIIRVEPESTGLTFAVIAGHSRSKNGVLSERL
jgi:hypothetical protein